MECQDEGRGIRYAAGRCGLPGGGGRVAQGWVSSAAMEVLGPGEQPAVGPHWDHGADVKADDLAVHGIRQRRGRWLSRPRSIPSRSTNRSRSACGALSTRAPPGSGWRCRRRRRGAGVDAAGVCGRPSPLRIVEARGCRLGRGDGRHEAVQGVRERVRECPGVPAWKTVVAAPPIGRISVMLVLRTMVSRRSLMRVGVQLASWANSRVCATGERGRAGVRAGQVAGRGRAGRPVACQGFGDVEAHRDDEGAVTFGEVGGGVLHEAGGVHDGRCGRRRSAACGAGEGPRERMEAFERHAAPALEYCVAAPLARTSSTAGYASGCRGRRA